MSTWADAEVRERQPKLRSRQAYATSDLIFPCFDLLSLQHVFDRLRGDVTELSGVRRDDLIMASICSCGFTLRGREELVEALAQPVALGEVLAFIAPAERIVRPRLVVTSVVVSARKLARLCSRRAPAAPTGRAMRRSP
jgi:hypothetical protein